jgi:hypothetical protein
MGIVKVINPRRLGGSTGNGSAIDSAIPDITGIAQPGEMCLVVNDVEILSLGILLASMGNVTVSFGDGTVNTYTNIPSWASTSTAPFTFTHDYGQGNPSGLGKYVPNEGCYCYVVKIYGATSPIAKIQAYQNPLHAGTQRSTVIRYDIQCNSLKDLSKMWSNGISVTSLRAPWLKMGYLLSADQVVSMNYMAYGAQDFFIYNFPDTPLCAAYDYALSNTGFMVMPLGNFGDVNASATNYVSACRKLHTLLFPPSWKKVTTIASIAIDNQMLRKVVLPTDRGSDLLTTCDYAFKNCGNLSDLHNEQYMGSYNSQTSYDGTFDGCEALNRQITIGSPVKKITAVGTSSIKCGITGFILQQAGLSLFAGSSYQIDMAYSRTSIENFQAFIDSLGVVSGKSIRTTGADCSAQITPAMITELTGKGYTLTN